LDRYTTAAARFCVVASWQTQAV